MEWLESRPEEPEKEENIPEETSKPLHEETILQVAENISSYNSSDTTKDE